MDFEDLIRQKTITLTGKNLSDGELGVLAEVLHKSKVLEELRLHNNWITLADGKLADALARNRTVRLLDLQNNNVGAKGAGRLAAALGAHRSLQKAYLSNNQMGDEGAGSVAGALRVNSSLKEVRLAKNKIGDEGAASLAAALEVNRGLCKVDLCDNRIGDGGVDRLVKALACNCVVKSVLLVNNPVGNAAMKSLKAILDDPNKLREIITKKNAEIQSLQEEIAAKDREMASKDGEIAAALAAQENQDPLPLLERFIGRQRDEIAVLKAKLARSIPIEETESDGKDRPRTAPEQKQEVLEP